MAAKAAVTDGASWDRSLCRVDTLRITDPFAYRSHASENAAVRCEFVNRHVSSGNFPKRRHNAEQRYKLLF